MQYCCAHAPEQEKQTAEILKKIAAAINALPNGDRAGLLAVFLGGGYGRGEGGVFTAADGHRRLYNDLDLFVIVPEHTPEHTRQKLRTFLKNQENLLSEEFEVEVEFGPFCTPHELELLSETLMYQELLRGHVPVWGDASVISHIRHLDFSRIPPEEAMRLLLNRGVGLLLAKEAMKSSDHSEEHCDFIARNIHKAALAAGDAFLLFRHEYTTGAEARGKRLMLHADFPASAKQCYQNALEFKFTPDPQKCEAARAQWQAVTATWLEELKELNCYCPMRPAKNRIRRLKDLLLNMRHFNVFPWKYLFCHPRWRLIRILPELLLDKSLQPEYINLLGWKDKRSRTEPETLERFLQLWRRFN